MILKINNKILREVYTKELQYQQTQLRHKFSPQEQQPTILLTTSQTIPQGNGQK